MQAAYGVPISDTKLWMLCKDLWNDVGIYIYHGLLEEMSKSDTLYVDDTTARVLEVTTSNNQKVLQNEKKDASCYSTVVSGETAIGQVVLYITKQSYCGKNISGIVSSGNKNIMSDASRMSIPDVEEKVLSTIKIFHCLAHGYRKFKDLKDYYPELCDYFMNEIKSIYEIEEQTHAMTDAERLEHHKKNSAIHVQNIYNKINELFANKIVEPNSHLGKAMKYWLNHRKGLTRFLTDPGVALDNNCSERYLKHLILQRKNSLFFKTLSSAEVLSGLTSIIATCREHGISSYDYLNWLQQNRHLIGKNSSLYLPNAYTKYINETERIAV